MGQKHGLAAAMAITIGLACSGSASPGDDGEEPSVSFTDPTASFIEDARGGEFVIRNIVVTDPAGVAKIGVTVGPYMGDPDVNVVGRTIYSPDSTNMSFSFPWAEVAPLFESGTPAKRVSVSVIAVDVFGNVNDTATARVHTLRSRVLWTLVPNSDTTPNPVFVDSIGDLWLTTAPTAGGGRIVHVDPLTGTELCSVTYAESVNGISEALLAGPNQEDLIIFGTDTGVRAVPRTDCLAAGGWSFVDVAGYNGHPVHDPARSRVVALNTVGDIVLIDAALGTENSRTAELGASFLVSPVITSSGNIYAGSANGNMFRFDSMMVRLDAISTAVDAMPKAIRADPVARQNAVYFGAHSGFVYRVDDTQPNAPIGKFLVDAADDQVESRPAITPDGTMLTTTLGTRFLYALRPTGEIRWSADLGSFAGKGGAAIHNESNGWSAYIGDTGGFIHGLNDDGVIQWQVDAKSEAITDYGTVHQRTMPAPATTLYINTIQTVYAIDVNPPVPLP